MCLSAQKICAESGGQGVQNRAIRRLIGTPFGRGCIRLGALAGRVTALILLRAVIISQDLHVLG